MTQRPPTTRETLIDDMTRMLQEARDWVRPGLVRNIRFLLPVEAYEEFVRQVIPNTEGTTAQAGIVYFKNHKVHRYPGPKIQIVCILEERGYDDSVPDIDPDEVIRRLQEGLMRLRTPDPTAYREIRTDGNYNVGDVVSFPTGPNTATAAALDCPGGSAPRFVAPSETPAHRTSRKTRKK